MKYEPMWESLVFCLSAVYMKLLHAVVDRDPQYFHATTANISAVEYHIGHL